MTDSNPSEIAVRAYTERANPKQRKAWTGTRITEPSGWVLVFDTETTVCAAQKLRVGSYQVRKFSKLYEQGLFYDPETISDTEKSMLQDYAVANGLKLITIEAFRRLFIKYGYKLNGTIVGFNLPFDISRIALKSGPAKGHMRGGFSFLLFTYTDQPAVRVKHLSARQAIIDFAAPGKSLDTRGMRNREIKVRHHRGFFIDVKTIAAALTSRSFSLESLCNFLDVETRKQASEQHGGPLTTGYLDYAMLDVQATWECFVNLFHMYEGHELKWPLRNVLSEASIGKAYLQQMGIRPLLACQPDIPREIFGKIMCSYYGGRAEIKRRRVSTQVLYTDFKSMYPTVNALMGLWDFVVADGMSWHDSTAETQAFLDSITIDDLQDKATWRKLRTLVQICPDNDTLPVRAKYNGKTHTIGLNHLTCDQPLWYTLADCIASKLLSGKTPKITQALTFVPGELQSGLKPIDLFGDSAFRVDPTKEDVFNRFVDLRDQAKADGNPVQQQIKIVANATSYGIFVEVQRDDAPKPEPLMIYGPNEEGYETKSTAIEQPGNFFHPLLATLITGAARLMLACAEKRTLDEGLGWVFCDTDSLAIARPEGLTDDEFQSRTEAVIDWFEPLNPYRKSGSILQIEDVNYEAGTKVLKSLYAFAISAKRYALFNLDSDDQPLLRKASAHGLGHLMPPYGEDDPAFGVPAPVIPLHEIGVKRWQYDLWFQIIMAALRGEPDRLCLDYHSALQKPALSRYGATSPALLRWMKHYNDGKPYHQQVKPFGFLVALTARTGLWLEPDCGTIADPCKRGRPSKTATPKPISPFERDGCKAAEQAFDRVTGEAVRPALLQTYAECLARYHMSPEDKFENADFADRGVTERRHILAKEVRLIGKEANKVGEAGQSCPVATTTNEYSTMKKEK